MEMNQQGNTTTNGTMYINNMTGEFYLKFLVYNVLNSTAIIEQDIESMPGWLVADAGPDKTVDEDVQVQFDGSGSADDIGITSYAWTFVDSTPKTLTGKTPTYTFSNPGKYTVTLNVTDATGNWATDMVTIAVRDTTPPTINTVSQIPSGDVDEGQLVKVSANITDVASGVGNASLIYSNDNCSSWKTPLPMIYNSTSGLYETWIFGHVSGTWVKYRIIAYDNAGNFVTENNAGQYYTYQVIPEFPATYLVLLFILTATLAATLVTVILSRKKKRPCNLAC
jgi:PKD repeat protein